MSGVTRGVVDARPVRREARGAAWSAAVGARDFLADEIRGALARDGIAGLVFCSEPGVYPPWVRLELWMPRPVGRERGELSVAIDALPYHEHSLSYTTRLRVGGRAIASVGRPEKPRIREWVECAAGLIRTPSDHTPMGDAFVNLLLAFIPFVHGLHHNGIATAFRGGFLANRAGILAALTGLVLLIGVNVAPPPVALPLTAAGVMVLGGCFIAMMNRRQQIAVVDQPEEPPRSLRLLDSWHTSLAGLAGQAGDLRARLTETLGQIDGVLVRFETYGSRTPNGFEQRDRLVAVKGQAVVYVHVQPFRDDLFLGWDAFLNWSVWGETAPVSSRVEDGAVTQFRSLAPAGYRPTDLDLMDVNALCEIVHRRMEQETRRLVAAHEIDLEIDFEVLRGDRGRALEARDAPAERGGFLSRLLGGKGSFGPGETERPRFAADAPARAAGRARWSAMLVLPVIAVAASSLVSMRFSDILAMSPFDRATTIAVAFGLPGLLLVFVGLVVYARRPVVAAGLAALSLYGLRIGTQTVLAVWFDRQRAGLGLPVEVTYLFNVAVSQTLLVLVLARLVPRFRRWWAWFSITAVSAVATLLINQLYSAGTLPREELMIVQSVLGFLGPMVVGYWFARAGEGDEA